MGLAARCENEPIIILRQLLADALKKPVPSERGEGPLAVWMVALRLMQLPPGANCHDELGLLAAGVLDTDRLCGAPEHAEEFRYRPPLFVAVSELVCGSTREGHGVESDAGMFTAVICPTGC